MAHWWHSLTDWFFARRHRALPVSLRLRRAIRTNNAPAVHQILESIQDRVPPWLPHQSTDTHDATSWLTMAIRSHATQALDALLGRWFTQQGVHLPQATWSAWAVQVIWSGTPESLNVLHAHGARFTAPSGAVGEGHTPLENALLMEGQMGQPMAERLLTLLPPLDRCEGGGPRYDLFAYAVTKKGYPLHPFGALARGQGGAWNDELEALMLRDEAQRSQAVLESVLPEAAPASGRQRL